MKKSLVALAVLAASGAAMAQSSVTLFGVVDAGVTYAKASGQSSIYGLSNSGNATSRLGFRGVEDLGGGLKAGFWLEGALQNDVGTGAGGGAAGPGLEFKRRSTLSLMGNFGEVRLGRELTTAYADVILKYDVFGQVGIGNSQAYLSTKSGSPSRVGNMVSYYTPNLSGFKAAVNYGFGEKAGDNSASRYIGGSVGYDNGPLSVTLAADQQNADYTLLGNTLDTVRSYSLGGAYNFGAAKLMGYLRQERQKALGGGTTKLNTAGLGVSAPVGAAGEVRASYNMYDLKSVDGKAHQLALGYVHNLSKRTALYGTYAFLKNKGSESFSLNASGLPTYVPAPGKSENAVTVGIRHAF